MRNLLSLQKGLIHVAAALNIYGFASSLIGVFIPLVILKSDGHLWEVPAFYLVYSCFKLVVNYPAALLIQKKGAHFGLGVAFIAGGLQMLSILGFTVTHSWVLLVMGAVSLSFTNAFSWNSQHLFISQAMKDDTKSSNIATIAIIGQVGNVVAPLLGGLIGAYLGSGYLLVLAVLLCFVALIPLRNMGGYSSGITTSKIIYNFQGAPAKDILANYFFNIETVVGVMVWPIYLAVFVASYKDIGTITAIAATATILTTWVAGHRGDKGQDRNVLKEGVAISSVIDIIRVFVTSQFWIGVVSSGYKASLAYFSNAWTSVYYHHAKQRGLQYIMSMEIANDLAYVSLWGVLLIALLTSSSSKVFFVTAFVIAAISAWGCLLITKQGVHGK
jgi:MFS family permease